MPGVLTARPLTERCAQVLEAGEHACIGVSPFNSYFSVERIAELAAWAAGRFAAFHLFVPDAAAALTLRALGYAPERAAFKARRQGQYVCNKICRALDALGVADPGSLVLDSAALETNARYRELAGAAEQDFETAEKFAAEMRAGVSWVLNGKVDPACLDGERLRAAAGYLLAELPLFTDTAGIVGAASSVFCYHQAPPFIARLFARELSWLPGEGQGFVVVEPATTTPEGTRQAVTPMGSSSSRPR